MRSVWLLLLLLLASGFASSQFQPAQPPEWADHVERDDLVSAGSTDGAQRVLRFVQISDAHIIDDDAPPPMRVGPGDELFYGIGFSESAERPQEEYTDEALDAMIRSINKIHGEDPLSFVINTGDNIDNELENELTRYLDNWEGTFTTRTPISGIACEPDGQSANLDDDGNDVTDTCTHLPDAMRTNNTPLAAGLPWFSAFGNHDGLIQGNVAPAPSFDDLADQFGRYFLRQHEYVDMHFQGADACPDGIPAGSVADDFGHGFGFAGERLCDDDVDNDGYYSFGSRGIWFVVLDTINDDPGKSNENSAADPEGSTGYDALGGLSEGAIDPEQFQWMLDEIDGHPTELVVLVSHHTINSIFNDFYERRCPSGCPGQTPEESGFVTTHQINEALSERPTVVAWIGGHTHKHRIEAKGLQDASSPGFWNVETSSIIDLPSEARVIEVWTDANGTKGFLALTTFTHDYESFKELSATDPQHDAGVAAGTELDQDVLLWFDIPPGVTLSPQESLPRFLAITPIGPERINGSHGHVGEPVTVEVEAKGSLLQQPVDGLMVNITIERGDDDANVVVATGSMNGTGFGRYTFTFTPDTPRVHFARLAFTDPSGLYPDATKLISIDVAGDPPEAGGKKSPGLPLAGILAIALLGAVVARRRE